MFGVPWFHTGVFAGGGGGGGEDLAEKQISFWWREHPPENLYKTTALRLRVLAAYMYMYPVCDYPKFVCNTQLCINPVCCAHHSSM